MLALNNLHQRVADLSQADDDHSLLHGEDGRERSEIRDQRTEDRGQKRASTL
jgi:hypothetical protein